MKQNEHADFIDRSLIGGGGGSTLPHPYAPVYTGTQHSQYLIHPYAPVYTGTQHSQLYLMRHFFVSRFFRLKKAVDMFKKFDADGSGSIEKDEFTQLMIAINCPKDKIPDALTTLDTDGDGKISFPEFLKWLNWLPN